MPKIIDGCSVEGPINKKGKDRRRIELDPDVVENFISVNTCHPVDIDSSQGFLCSSLGSSEKELVAWHIVDILRQKNPKEWTEFNRSDYEQSVNRAISRVELEIHNSFVKNEYLRQTDNGYTVTDKFVQALEKYVKK